MLKNMVRTFGRLYTSKALEREWKMQKEGKRNERMIEYRFALECLCRVAPQTVLDVGSGRTAFPAVVRNCGFAVTATDNIHDYWPKGMFNRHYHVVHDDIVNTGLDRTFDFVTCISTLEHIPNHEQAVGNIFKLLNPGGHVVLTFPYNEKEYVPNAYALPTASHGQNNPYVCQIYSRANVDAWTGQNGAEVVAQEYWSFYTGDYWASGDRVFPPVESSVNEKHHLTCLLLRKK